MTDMEYRTICSETKRGPNYIVVILIGITSAIQRTRNEQSNERDEDKFWSEIIMLCARKPGRYGIGSG